MPWNYFWLCILRVNKAMRDSSRWWRVSILGGRLEMSQCGKGVGLLLRLMILFGSRRRNPMLRKFRERRELAMDAILAVDREFDKIGLRSMGKADVEA